MGDSLAAASICSAVRSTVVLMLAPPEAPTVIATVAAAREGLMAGLRQVPGFVPLPGCANFILVDVSASGLTSARLRQALGETGILIRDCANYPGLSADYIRVAVKLPAQNDRLVASLKTIIKGSDLD